MLVDVIDVVTVEVDITDASSVFDTDFVNVSETAEASILLGIRLVEKVSDGEVCSLLDVTEEDIVDFIGVSILVDATVLNVTEDSSVLDNLPVDSAEVCSLLDVILVAITDVLEVSPLLVTTMVEVIDCEEVSILLDVTLVLNIIDSEVGCTVLDMVLIGVADNVEEGLLFDSSRVTVTVGAVVEITEVSSLLDIVVANVVFREMIDDVITGVLYNEEILSLLDITLVGKIDNKDVT